VIRKATIDDVDWMLSIAATAYPKDTFEEAAGRNYLTAIVNSDRCLLLRGEKSFMGGAVVSIPYAPSVKYGTTLPIASSGNAASEILKMTKQILEWAKDKGVAYFNFDALTGVDLGPLAKRFNGLPISPTYSVRINHVR